MIIVVNNRCHVIINCSHHFDQEQEHSKGNWQLLLVEPHAHDSLLYNGHAITHSENQSAGETHCVIFSFEAVDEHPLSYHA